MGNTLAHSWRDDMSEGLTTGELVSTLEQALEKKDGYFPTHLEVDEAIRVFLLHMQAINPSCIKFLQAILRNYYIVLNNATDSEKRKLTGLQGYIHYVKEWIIKPLKQSPKIRAKSAIAHTKQIQILNLDMSIAMNKDILRALENVRQDVQILLDQADKPDELDELAGQLSDIQNIMQGTEKYMRDAEVLRSKLINTNH